MVSCEQNLTLLSSLLTGELSDAETAALDAHLGSCRACRASAGEMVRVHRALAETAGTKHLEEMTAAVRTAISDTKPVSLPLRRSRMTSRRWLAVAAAVLLIAGGLAYLVPRTGNDPQAAPMAHLQRAQGEVYVVDGARKVRINDSDQPPFSAGQGLQTVGEESSVAVVFADGTRLEVGPDTLIQSIQEDKRVLLTTGFVSADVAPLPDDRPMVLVTPLASMTANKTRLSVTCQAKSTQVEVEAGVVAVKGRDDAEAVRVAAGSSSVVAQTDQRVTTRPLRQSSQPHRTLPDETGRTLAVAFHPDNRRLATGGRDGVVRIWDLQEESPTPRHVRAYARQEIRSLAFSPDGSILAVGGDASYAVKLIDVESGKEIAKLPMHKTWIETLVFTADGRTLIVAGAHGYESSRVYFWNVETRKVIDSIEGHPGGVWALALAPNQQTLATTGRDGKVKLWDLETRRLRRTLVAHSQEATSVAFSADSQRLVSAGKDRSTKIWDVATGAELLQLNGGTRVACAFDGLFATTGPDAAVRCRNVSDGQEQACYRMHAGGSGLALAVSADGNWIACVGQSKYIKVWKVLK